MEEEAARRSGGDRSSHYIVELDGPGSGRFVLCERVRTSDGSDAVAGLPREAVMELFERDPLRAVALPASIGGPRSHLAKAIGPQLFSVNININGVTPDRGD